MLPNDSKYTSALGLGGIATTIVGLLVAAGVLTPEQGNIIGLHLVPIIGGVVAILGAFTVYHTPADIKTQVPDTTKRDPFGNRS